MVYLKIKETIQFVPVHMSKEGVFSREESQWGRKAADQGREKKVVAASSFWFSVTLK